MISWKPWQQKASLGSLLHCKSLRHYQQHLSLLQANFLRRKQWYKGLNYGKNSKINAAYYGPSFADAVSANTPTDVDFYQSFHKFRLEWTLNKSEDKEQSKEEGFIRWYLDDEFLFEIKDSVISQEYGSLPGKQLPAEPMYLIFNTAVSSTWFVNLCFSSVCSTSVISILFASIMY